MITALLVSCLALCRFSLSALVRSNVCSLVSSPRLRPPSDTLRCCVDPGKNILWTVIRLLSKASGPA